MPHNIPFNAAALGGGGGCGAYQTGVMKALAEYGVLKNIVCYSGTSVGALNAVLFSIGDIELAEYVWSKWVDPVGMLGKIEFGPAGVHSSRDTLKAILKNVGVTRIKNTAPVYACAYNLSLGHSEYFLLNDRSEEDIINILLASSAMSVIYSPVTINGYTYIDGGSSVSAPTDNFPTEILYEKGFRDILLVPLMHDFDLGRIRSWIPLETADMREMFPEANISVIKPSRNIGSIVDFTPARLKRRAELGYCDTKAFFDGNGSKNPDHDEIIRSLAEKYIKNGDDLMDFLALRKHKHITAELPTLGGHFWYRDIFTADGFRIQWHCFVPLVGKLFECHYRILGRNNELKAYYFDPDEFTEDLRIFGKQKENGKIKHPCREKLQNNDNTE